MKDKQISVLISNQTGELANMTSQMAKFNINIKAISVSDAMDYRVIRLITSDAERAGAALREAGYGFVMNEVLVSEIPDKPGALAELCGKLTEAGISIRYVYATVTPGGGVALAVLSTADNNKAESALSQYSAEHPAFRV